MKRIILSLALVLTGCVHSTTTTPVPLAPGYSNPADQQLASALAGANFFYNKLQMDQKAGTFKPSQAEVTALNSLQVALVTANPIYLAYHNGTATLQAAQSAINNVTSAEMTAKSVISGGK